jgi:folate-binding protein YgfZ
MTAREDPVAALDEGRAFVDLSSWWKVGVEGSDAEGWLNDLLSAELGGLEPRTARPSLLLTPTGRIRAAMMVVAFEGAFLLVQDPTQPSRIDSLLDPYVLSSDVRLRDRTEELDLYALPGRATEGDGSYSPSALGPGADLLIPEGEKPEELDELSEAELDDVETWRIRRGVARFGVDLTTDSLPHEAELGDVIAYGKGCFLGQEAVARVRNLGHPPFVVLAATAEGSVGVGETLMSDDREAGTITSAAPVTGGDTAAIARVRWALKDAALRTPEGVELRSARPASAA